jgi:hypothetical protein
MTVEPPPSSDSHGPDAAPVLRASDADRDRAVEILRVAAGDGRLSLEELDERLEAVPSARTRSRLTAMGAPIHSSADPDTYRITSI